MGAPKGSRGRTLFISDLHLDEARPSAVAQFERFLADFAPGADYLYILGDLFESWIGDDGINLPLPARTASRLFEASTRVPIAFMHGNRDFLVAERFAAETGVKLLVDPTVVDLYGTPTVLLHGDTLCTEDQAYQRFRAQVRDPAWQAVALARPLAERVAIAQTMRTDSEGAKQGKSMEIMDVSPAAVDEAFATSGCAVMIHGHTHRPGRHAHVVNGRECVRWVLSDWYSGCGYLEASPEGIRAVDGF
ncbi:MAG: UDP-2,3-diacylglucosamine diphosphatase [Usitatibacter sp.]